MMLQLTLCVIFAVILSVHGQRFLPGPCRNITAKDSFDKHKFFGKWIETEKTPSVFDMILRCMTVFYTDDKDGTIDVNLKGVSLAGLPVSIKGDGLLQDVTREGFYSIRYGFGVPFQGTLTTIVDTDYEEYALVYSCTNSLLRGAFHSEYIWLLSRDGVLSNPSRQNLYEKLDSLKINRSGLQRPDRAGCPSNITREESAEDSFLPKLSSTALPEVTLSPLPSSSSSSLPPASSAAAT